MKNTLFIAFFIIIIAAGAWMVFKSPSETEMPIAPVGESQSQESAGVYTLEQVAMHNTDADCWMAIGGAVLDVTQYIASGEHNPKISQGCGLEATEMFNNIKKHAGSEAQELLTEFTIGRLAQ